VGGCGEGVVRVWRGWARVGEVRVCEVGVW